MYESKPYLSSDVILYLEDKFNASNFAEMKGKMSSEEFDGYLAGVGSVINELKEVYKEKN